MIATRRMVEIDSNERPGTRLIAADGRELPLRGVQIRVRARGGYARVVLEQQFINPYDEPLRVSYLVPLPADGAVSAYAFTLAGRRIVGAIDSRSRARERFEQALVEGRTAALFEQQRSSVFTQEIGNVPARAEVRAEIVIDQPLRWLDQGAWEWRFPTVVGPRYSGSSARVPDAHRLESDVLESPPDVAVSLALDVLDDLPASSRPASPSHPISATLDGGAYRVTVPDGRLALDRDVVVTWRVSGDEIGTTIEAGRSSDGRTDGDAFALLTLVPPKTVSRSVARDLVVLLDTSGSMSGLPIECAKRVVSGLIESLSDEDTIELVQFSTAPRRWRESPARATSDVRRDALAWVRSLGAGGGTEMREGILEALRPRRDGAQRQVVLVTDGLIGFEREIVVAIGELLPNAARVHTVGIGSSINRSLTGPAARAGRGVEVLVGLDEDVEPAIARLVARTRSPVVTELSISGTAVREVAPERTPDLYAGAPVRLALRLRPEGGEVVVRGRSITGEWEWRKSVRSVERGEGPATYATLFAREAVEDLETRIASGGDVRVLDSQIERLGLQFGIATRLTSWVAMTGEVTVDPSAPSRSEEMPHALPHGMSVEGLGLRAAAAATLMDVGEASFGFAERSMARAPRQDVRGGFIPPQSRAAPAAPPPLGGPPPAPGGRAKAPPPPAPQASPMRPTGAPPAPPAEAPPPARKSRGVVDTLRNMLTPSRAARGAGKSDEARPKTIRKLRARVVRRDGKRLVLEFTVDKGGPIDWRTDAPSEALTKEGETDSVVIVAHGSTAAGSVVPGGAILVAFDLPAEDDVIAEVRIELTSCTLVLTIA